MEVDIKHFHFCSGMAGAAKGFNLARPRVAGMQGVMRCLGGIDHDPLAVTAFDRVLDREGLGTVMDLFTLEHHMAFHGKSPPIGWAEAGVEDIRRAAGGEVPNFVFMSPPCKSYSPLVSLAKIREPKYVALSSLPIRCWKLALAAWIDDPPEVLWMENVGRIWDRGRKDLDEIASFLELAGYAVNYTKVEKDNRPGGVRCIGTWGRLACRRPRFFLVARHLEKLPHPILEPPDRGYRSIGDVIGRLPLPGDPSVGPMHDLPLLQWLTWLRLSLIMPGKDHRYLRTLRLDDDGNLADFRVGRVGRRHTVPSVATPENWHQRGPLGVRRMDQQAMTITGKSAPSSGGGAVADPSLPFARFRNIYRVLPMDDVATTVTGGQTPSSGGVAVADVRTNHVGWERGGSLGILPMEGVSPTIAAMGKHDNGYGSVADDRFDGADQGILDEMPGLRERGRFLIRSPWWGCYHRPFTRFDKLALMGFVDLDSEAPDLPGSASWQHGAIGNAVPVWSAMAIAEAAGLALLSYWSEQPLQLSIAPRWVGPLILPFGVSR